MADINTDSSSSGSGFIFGQNMEDRVVKPEDEKGKAGENGACGETEEASDHHASGLIRPSAFTHGPVLAAGKLGPNPFVSTQGAGSCDSVLAPSRLASNPFASRPAPPNMSHGNSDSDDGATNRANAAKMILRPSTLDKQTANFVRGMGAEVKNDFKTSFRLAPPILSSPFSAKEKEKGEQSNGNEEPAVAASETVEGKKRLFGDSPSESTKENYWKSKSSEEGSKGDSTDVSTSSASGFLFGQSIEARVESASSSVEPQGSSFVFGQNLASRVIGADGRVCGSEDTADKDSKSPVAGATSPTQTLEESAAAHQAKISRPELQEVEVKTGEEDESNVFQFHAKLYAFDKDTQNWLEKGRGLIRLNDMSMEEESGVCFQSRLVMRTQGSLRVVLNTKIWAGMMVEQPSLKSIRITAMDEDSVKVFLIQANPKDADQIFKAIDWRVQQLKMKDSQWEEGTDGLSESQDDEGLGDMTNKSTVLEIHTMFSVYDEDSKKWGGKESGLLLLHDITTDEPDPEKPFQSQLAIRAPGSGRMLLFTKLQPGTKVEKRGGTGIRIMTHDGQKQQTYLLEASREEAEKIHAALDSRVQKLKSHDPSWKEEESTRESVSCSSMKSDTGHSPEKRKPESTEHAPTKKVRLDPEQRRDLVTEESNDSSTIDPETEVSSESFTSTTNRSSSSE